MVVVRDTATAVKPEVNRCAEVGDDKVEESQVHDQYAQIL
jgi:hypothetical protein